MRDKVHQMITYKLYMWVYPFFHKLIPFWLSNKWSFTACDRKALLDYIIRIFLWVRISIRARCTTLCDKVCQWLATSWWFSLGPPVSSTNKTDRHDITEVLLKVALSTIKQPNKTIFLYICSLWTFVCSHFSFQMINKIQVNQILWDFNNTVIH